MPNEDFTPADVAWLQRWTAQKTSIVIRNDQTYLLKSRLSPIARSAGITLEDLVSQLRRGDRMLEQACSDAMTTNETSWFRDVKPFDVLASTLLPRRIEKAGTTRSLDIWSAASSGGQELYSIAMQLKDKFPELDNGWNVRMLGTDLSHRMVDKASKGVYSQIEVDRGLPAKYMVRYFEKSGLDWQIRADIRQGCQFRTHNLVTDPAPGQFDIVFCRYVLIYFNDDDRAKVISRITNSLKPGGILVLGASEIGGRHVEHLRLEIINGVSVYTRDT